MGKTPEDRWRERGDEALETPRYWANQATKPLSPEFLAWAVEGYRLAQNTTEAGFIELNAYFRANLPFTSRVAYLGNEERDQVIRAYHESLEQSPDAQPETQPPRD